jgi:hypothetical protein
MLGALVGFCAIWIWALSGLPDLSAYNVRPLLAPAGFYPRLIWGGLWGLLFFFTIGSVRTRKRWVQKGVLISLLPSLYFLVFFLPEQIGSGLELSLVSPAIVVVLNLIWGIFTGLFTRMIWGRN